MIEKKQILSEWFVGILRPGILVITETLIWKDYVESVNLGMDFTLVKHGLSLLNLLFLRKTPFYRIWTLWWNWNSLFGFCNFWFDFDHIEIHWFYATSESWTFDQSELALQISTGNSWFHDWHFDSWYSSDIYCIFLLYKIFKYFGILAATFDDLSSSSYHSYV